MIIHKYRLHIPGTKYWYRVLVFETTRQMNEYYKHSEFRRLINDNCDKYFYGTVQGWGIDKRTIGHNGCEPALSNQLGEVLLSKQHLTASVLPHEAVHMVAFYLKSIYQSRGIGFCLDDKEMESEENFAYLVGQITAMLNERFKKYGLYD